MKRAVKVYRAERPGADGKVTAPEFRKPFDTFEIIEARVDKARELARAECARRLGESVASALVCTDGSISITLRARA